MMLKKLLTYLVVSLFSVSAGWADIYKCVSEDGVVKYSEDPCGRTSELVIAETSLSVDEAIGNGSPYPEPVPYSVVLGQDILAHGLSVGNSIFQDKYLKSSDIAEEADGAKRSWNVTLSYLNPEKDFDYADVELRYVAEPEGKRIFIRLTYIRMMRFDWATPLKTLKKIRKLKRDGHFGWKVLPQR